MKWFETLGILVGIGAMTQFIAWILNSLGLKSTLGQETVFFISFNFSLIIAITLILIQIQSEQNQIVAFLKIQGYKKEKVNSVQKKRGKKGAIDARILWIAIGIVLLYLIYKVIVG